MNDVVEDQTNHRRPHPQPMAAPFLEIDLARELNQLRREPEWARGQNAKTLDKHDDFRIVLIVLTAHRKIPGHQTAGRVSIHAVTGHVLVRAEGRTFDLPAGRIVALDRGIFTNSKRSTRVRCSRRSCGPRKPRRRRSRRRSDLDGHAHA
jgi:hypothetical protein